eukprot:11988128-Alexandrium_andersonii.AAC.1
MVPEPPDASDGLVDRIVAQAPLVQRWARQDRPRIAILNHQDNKRLVAGVLAEEAIAHCDLRRTMRT